MFELTSKGDYKKTERYLDKLVHERYFQNLMKYGEEGVAALSAATPKDTGLTAASWAYEIVHGPDGLSINWINTNVNKGVNIAVILQYGHGTGTGGYVEGIDYINPAMRTVFEDIAERAWREVTSG